MSYGFGLAGEGLGAFTKGAREQQEHEARREERNINQLYTRYQLANARRQEAEKMYQEHATAVGEAASGSAQEAEVFNSRDEERKLRQSLYDTLSGKSPKVKGFPKGGPKGIAKSLLYRALGMDEAQKTSDQGYDQTPAATPSGVQRRPMDERLPDGRTVTEAVMGRGPAPGFKIGSDQQPMPTAPGTQRPYSLPTTGEPTEKGNIDLYGQPEVKNPDGTTSTVHSRSYNIDGQEVLLPAVTPDGRHLQTDDEIVEEYRKTGRHLGKFQTPAEATAYGSRLSQEYASGKYRERPASAPGMAPRAKELTLGAIAETPPIAGPEQIPQDVEEPNRGQFAPEGRVQAGLPYQFTGAEPRSASDLRGDVARKIPMAGGKAIDAATKLRVEKEAGNILQNLEGYVDHVKRTKITEDDSFEYAQKDPGFNRYLGALKSLEAQGYLKPNTIDENLDKWFVDSPARMRARPVPTEEQRLTDEFYKTVGQPGGPKTFLEAQQMLSAAKSRGGSARSLLETAAIEERRKTINKKTNKPYTEWEILQSLPRATAVLEDSGPLGGVISGVDTTGSASLLRVPKIGQQGTEVTPMTGGGPRIPKISRSELMMEAPQFVTDKSGKPTGLHPFRGRKILSAQAIIDAHKRDPNAMTWDDVYYYAETPSLFEDKNELELLKQLIKELESLRPTRRSRSQNEAPPEEQ